MIFFVYLDAKNITFTNKRGVMLERCGRGHFRVRL